MTSKAPHPKSVTFCFWRRNVSAKSCNSCPKKQSMLRKAFNKINPFTRFSGSKKSESTSAIIASETHKLDISTRVPTLTLQRDLDVAAVNSLKENRLERQNSNPPKDTHTKTNEPDTVLTARSGTLSAFKDDSLLGDGASPPPANTSSASSHSSSSTLSKLLEFAHYPFTYMKSSRCQTPSQKATKKGNYSTHLLYYQSMEGCLFYSRKRFRFERSTKPKKPNNPAASISHEEVDSSAIENLNSKDTQGVESFRCPSPCNLTVSDVSSSLRAIVQTNDMEQTMKPSTEITTATASKKNTVLFAKLKEEDLFYRMVFEDYIPPNCTPSRKQRFRDSVAQMGHELMLSLTANLELAADAKDAIGNDIELPKKAIEVASNTPEFNSSLFSSIRLDTELLKAMWYNDFLAKQDDEFVPDLVGISAAILQWHSKIITLVVEGGTALNVPQHKCVPSRPLNQLQNAVPTVVTKSV